MNKKHNTKKEEDAMSNNRSLKKVLAVALLSTMGLVACGGEVQAKPSDYKDSLISFTDSNDEIYHNLVSIIEDAYRDGALAGDVLDKILYVYATSVFGVYNKVVTPAVAEGDHTLKEAYADIMDNDGSYAVADAFIEKHKAYQVFDDKGNRTTDKSKEYHRVTSKWSTIEDRISRDLYNAISGGSYSERGFFSEKKYLQSLINDLQKVASVSEATYFDYEDKIVITPEVDEEKVFFDATSNPKGYLHRANYQSNFAYNASESADAKIRYVEDELIPTIYRSLLVEQYLLDESYNNLGRSAARKVNVISISDNSNNDKASDYLMKYFVRNVISGGKITKTGAELTSDPYYVDLEDFKAVSEAVVGVSDAAQDYIANVNSKYPGAFVSETIKATDNILGTGALNYYRGTDYGDMMENFKKMTFDINTTDTSVESDYTGSGAYPISVGYQIKTNELKTKNYVTDGYFISTNSVADLPDSVKTRLFNIGVSTVLDNDDTVDRFETTTYTVPEKESKLVAKINGKYYLKVASKQAGALDKDDILFKEDGKYYVIQIEEAVSGSKLSKTSDVYEKDASNPDRKEDIINEVARVVASNDTYKSLSTKHWLEKAAIKYHDTKIYDYFKDNYPDLFD